MELVENGVGESDQCRDTEVLGCFLCRGGISLSPLLPVSPSVVGKGAVEQDGQAGVFADVGQAVNANTVPR